MDSFFWLSKIFWIVAAPGNFLLLWLAFGALLTVVASAKWRKLGRFMVGAAVLVGLAGKPALEFIKAFRPLRPGVTVYALSVLGTTATEVAVGDSGTFPSSGQVKLLCRVRDAQGVKQAKLTFQGGSSDTCTVGSAVFSGAFPLHPPLPSTMVQDISEIGRAHV